MTTLKRWESPRKSGRNDKGRGGSARQRQLRKREKRLRQHLKSDSANDSQKFNNPQKERPMTSLFLWSLDRPGCQLSDRKIPEVYRQPPLPWMSRL